MYSMMFYKASNRFTYVILATLLLTLVSCRSIAGEPLSQKSSLDERLRKLEAAAPGVGEIMTSVQFHFARLHFATEAKNWDRARYEIDEVEENLDKVAVLRPEDKGVQLIGVIDAFKQTQLDAMKKGVESKDNQEMISGLLHLWLFSGG